MTVRTTPRGEVIPPRLCKYQPPTEQALDNLEKRVVWASRPEAFNDPLDSALAFRVLEPDQAELMKAFDLYATERGLTRDQGRAAGLLDEHEEPTDKLKHTMVSTMERFIRDRMKEGRTDRGITCFSEDCMNPLLWAHYADGHRGFCVELKTSDPLFEKVLKVTYSGEWPEAKILDIWEEYDDPSHWMRHFITKALWWRYEDEWRCLRIDGEGLLRYRAKSLNAIYLGAMMSDAHKQAIARILGGSQTQLYEVKHEPHGFALKAAPLR